MRVVHVVCTSAFAGVEQHVARLAAAQVRLGHEVLVLGGDPDATARVARGARVRPVGGLLRTARDLRRAARSADVVHVHMTAAETAAALGLLGRRDAPAVVSTRHFAAPRGSGRLAPAVAHLARSRVAAQISISRYVADHVDGPSEVVLPGLTVSDGVMPDATEREDVVLVVQRLEAEKDTATAVRAFARSRLAAEGWALQVAGSGSCLTALRDLAAHEGVANAVQFLGHRDDVPQLMARAAVLLAPCPSEGLGLSVLEGMAHGLPVVASGSGGHLETVGRVPAAPLFGPCDADDAAAVLRAVALDVERRRELARHGLGIARAASPEAQALATDAVYRKARA